MSAAISGTFDLDDDRELDLKKAGLRFVRPDLEAAYRDWHGRRMIPVVRVGMWASFLVWPLAVAGLGFAAPEEFARHRAAVLGLVVAICAGCLAVLALTLRPSMGRWMALLTGLSNVVAGVVAVVIAFVLLGLPDVSTGGVMIVAFFAFTVYRLRPEHAATAVALYLLLHEALLFRAPAGMLGRGDLVNDAMMPLIATVTGLVVGVALDRISRLSFRQELVITRQRAAIDRERSRADRLLLSIFPASIAEELKRGRASIAQRFDEVTVLFADLAGFTPLAARLPPESVVELLNDVFTRFDALAERFGVEKVKTIGDAYMAVAGAPAARTDHASIAADLALAMREAIRDYAKTPGREEIRIRIGLGSGPAVAGVIGSKKFAYDLWGDTVNLAARMESQGVPDAIQLPESTRKLLDGRHVLEERGVIEVKGKGPMRVWLLGAPAITPR
jgi:class 3 adenylate cyclase